ncbi:hypothetical protein CPB85DRAFT_104358 [Mucidula mucida]|nr:hypothetical protein CPB85DRAFT_104358 [Mucidula mucida]
MTRAAYIRFSSSTDLIPLGPKRKPASSNTSHRIHPSSTHPPLSFNANITDKPNSKPPPTGPRAYTTLKSRSNSPDRRVMKGLPPTGPRATRTQGPPAYPSYLSTPTPRGPRAGAEGSSTSLRVFDSGWASRLGSAKLRADQREGSAVRYDPGSKPDASLETTVVANSSSKSLNKFEKPAPLSKFNTDPAMDLEAIEKLRKEQEPLEFPRVPLKPAQMQTFSKFKKTIQTLSIPTCGKDLFIRKREASTPASSSTSASGHPPPVPLLTKSSPAAAGLSTTASCGRPRSPSPVARYTTGEPTRPADLRFSPFAVEPLFTPPKGSDAPLFTPPSSPLSSLPSPEPVARSVETLEHEDDVGMLFSDDVQVTNATEKTTKKMLQVCVMVPRLSKSERKSYEYRDEETLGAKPLTLPDPRRSVSSVPPATAIKRTSSSTAPPRPSTSSSVQRSSASTSSCTPPLSTVQRKAKQKASGHIKHLQSETTAYVINEFFELENVVEVEQQRVVHTPNGSAGPSTSGPSTSKIPVASTSTLPGPSTSKFRALPVNSGSTLVSVWNSAPGSTPGRKEKAKVVADSRKQRDKPVIDKGQGKARVVDNVDDEVVIVSVERAGTKKRKRINGEAGNVAKKARKQQEACSTSSSKILTLEFEEAMDDEALYSVVKEPGAIDISAAWNYERKWATDVHVIRSDVLRRNLKGYRRALLGNDDWYEEEGDEEDVGEWDGARSDMEPESPDEPEVIEAPVKIEANDKAADDQSLEASGHVLKGKRKKPIDIRDKLRLQRQREEQEALGWDMIVPLHRGDDHEQQHPVHDGTINPALLGSVEADAMEYAESSDEEDEVVMAEDEVLMAEPHADVGDGEVDAEADTDTDGEDAVPLRTLVAKRRATCDKADKDQQSAVPEIDSRPLDKAVSGAEDLQPPPPVHSAVPKPKGKGRTPISSVYPRRSHGDEIFCHQCRRKSWLVYMQCRSTACTRKSKGKIYCQRCIVERYDDYEFVAGKVDQCPSCEGICSCDVCTRKRGEEYVGPYAPSQRLAEEDALPRRKTPPNTTSRPSRQIKRPVRFVQEQPKPKEKRGCRTVVTTRPGLLSGTTMWEPVEARIAKAEGSQATSGTSTSPQSSHQAGGAVHWGEIYGAEHAVRVGSAWVPATKRKFDGDEDGGGKVYVQRKRVYVGAVVPEWGLGDGGREGPGRAHGTASISMPAPDRTASGEATCAEQPKKRRRCFIGDPRPLTLPLRPAPAPAPTPANGDVKMDVNIVEHASTDETKASDHEQDFGTWETESVLSELTPIPSPERVEDVGEVDCAEDAEAQAVPVIIPRGDLIRAVSAGMTEVGRPFQLQLDLKV